MVEQKSGGPITQPDCQVGHSQGGQLSLSLRPWRAKLSLNTCLLSCFEIPILLVDHRNSRGRGQELLDEDKGCKPQSPAQSDPDPRLPTGPGPHILQNADSRQRPCSNSPICPPWGTPAAFRFKYLTLTCLIFSKAKGIKDELLKRLMFLTAPPPKSQPGSFVSKTHFTGINFLIKY